VQRWVEEEGRITAAARRGRGRRSPAGLTGGSLEEEREGVGWVRGWGRRGGEGRNDLIRLGLN
jgi:hypothetical protein